VVAIQLITLQPKITIETSYLNDTSNTWI